MKSLLQQLQKRFDDAYLFSATASLQEDTYSYIPKGNQYEELDTMVMSRIMDRQKRQKLDNPKKLKHILFIIDDMIAEAAIRTDRTIMKLFVQGRHYGISVMVTSQVVGSRVSIPPEIRNNSEYILSFSLFSEPDRKILIERFGSITNAKEGIGFFKKITQEKWQCCIFDTTQSQANTLEEMMFKYQAPENIKKFMIGKNRPKDIINAEFTQHKGRKKRGPDLQFSEPNPRVEGQFDLF